MSAARGGGLRNNVFIQQVLSLETVFDAAAQAGLELSVSYLSPLSAGLTSVCKVSVLLNCFEFLSEKVHRMFLKVKSI